MSRLRNQAEDGDGADDPYEVFHRFSKARAARAITRM